MSCSHRLWGLLVSLKSGGISPTRCPCLKVHVLQRLESSSWGNGKPMLGTSISADTGALQNAQFILNVKKKTDSQWGKYKEVPELGKNRSYERGQQRKKTYGQINTEVLKENILREFSKGFPSDTETSHLRCNNHSRHEVIRSDAEDLGWFDKTHDILWLQELLIDYCLLMLFICLH